jgi:hypothetical protein
VKEANALGTAYLRADTIAEPQRSELKAAIKEYTDDRVTLLSRGGHDQIEPLLAKVSGLHERMWKSAINATQGNAPLMAVILPPINEIIDLHSMHLASVGMIGFGNGRVGRRFSVLDAVYGIALAAALWMTIDLNYPGIGLIRVSNLPRRGNLGCNALKKTQWNRANQRAAACVWICSGVVAVVGKVVAASKILVVRQVLFAVLLSVFVSQILFGVLFAVIVSQILLAVLFAVVVRQILLAVLFSVGCTRTGSAE